MATSDKCKREGIDVLGPRGPILLIAVTALVISIFTLLKLNDLEAGRELPRGE